MHIVPRPHCHVQLKHRASIFMVTDSFHVWFRIASFMVKMPLPISILFLEESTLHLFIVPESSIPSSYSKMKVFILGYIFHLCASKDYHFSSIHRFGFKIPSCSLDLELFFPFKHRSDFHFNYSLPEGIHIYILFTILTRTS